MRVITTRRDVYKPQTDKDDLYSPRKIHLCFQLHPVGGPTESLLWLFLQPSSVCKAEAAVSENERGSRGERAPLPLTTAQVWMYPCFKENPPIRLAAWGLRIFSHGGRHPQPAGKAVAQGILRVRLQDLQLCWEVTCRHTAWYNLSLHCRMDYPPLYLCKPKRGIKRDDTKVRPLIYRKGSKFLQGRRGRDKTC